MNLSEFRAWFDGFTENLDGKIPSAKAWKRIQARVAEIKTEPTPIQRFIHDYPWYRPHWQYLPGYFGSVGSNTATDITEKSALMQVTSQAYQSAVSSTECFNDMGRQEAKQIA